ncbi:membrane protein insertion efficiency factor YidD [Candidatus Uhrbacteria bacterium]|nr:membrane protein insertion efficiency factor YidD [Candidatus Uhrbacteria bacterium]
MKQVAVILIKLYQKTLSFDHGPLRVFFPSGFCRYYPTCSEYTRQAVLRRGFLNGFWLGLARILRCHPWAKGGVDLVK